MEIKSGLVQYNGRNDIPCSYVDMEDGTRYFIKDNLDNGNYIVTTSLLEAVDPMAKAQNIGLVDANGNALLPCDNKSYKIVDGILLAEKAEPVSEGVKEANSLRMDPLSATKFVSTSAHIKEIINAKMSPEGRYLYNDQFSDISLFDFNGNNLVNNEYYSFIAKDNDKLFMTKNNIDTPVYEFSITDKKIVENENVNTISNEEVQNTVGNEFTETPVTPIDSSLGQEISIPQVDDNISGDFSFDVAEETPTTEVEGGEEYENEFAKADEAIKSLEEKNNMVSSLDQLIGNNYEVKEEVPQEVDYTPVDRFAGSEVQISSIDRAEDDSYIDDRKDTIDDASRLIDSFTETLSEKDEMIRREKEENQRLREEIEEVKRNARNFEKEFNYLKGENEKLEISNKKMSAKIDSLTDVVDLYKRKDEETRRSVKALTTALNNYNAVSNKDSIYDEEDYSYRRVA